MMTPENQPGGPTPEPPRLGTPSSPPPLTQSIPPPFGGPAQPAVTPPPLLPKAQPGPATWRRLVGALLSLCLSIFLADAVVSLLDDSLIVFFGIHALAALRGILVLFAVLVAVVVYGLMAFTPAIPKRLFLPLVLFYPTVWLLAIPLAIRFYERMPQITWVFSFCQFLLGLLTLARLQGGLRFQRPLVPQELLSGRGFGWRNLLVFIGANLVVGLPGVAVYLFVCVSIAASHFSEGFISLRPSGFSVQVRKYVRADGKTVQLVPMAHVGDSSFYRDLSRSFPTNALILMEGVTDDHNLLTNHISYKRMAASLGLAEQQKEFKPIPSQVVRADVDIGDFTTNTIGFLNLVMMIHSKGLTPENMQTLLQFSPPPDFDRQLFDDLLHRRNRRLLDEVQTRLPESDYLVVPWGAAHMPGISSGILKAGFHVAETRDVPVIRFRFFGGRG
jgi:hypothetical protein